MMSLIARGAWALVGLFVLLTTGLGAETRHIHVLKIFDDHNRDYVIREGCRSIGFGIDEEVAQMEAHLGVTNVITYDIKGDNFNLAYLDQVLDYEMAYQERDIVILVFVGHGFRSPDTRGPFPELYFNSYTESVNYADIQERILEKNPSILLNIVVACNVTQTDRGAPPPYRSVNTPPATVSLKGGVRHQSLYEGLFADEDGVTKIINLVSATEEYYTFISNDGGIFFNEILYTLQEALAGYPYEGWQDMCQTIMERTVSRSEHLGLSQQPYCSYHLRFYPVELSAPAPHSLLEPSPCALAARELRQQQRQDLRELRRRHRREIQQARQHGLDRNERRLLGQQQRVAYESQKLRHEQEYQRRLQLCQ
ncbi:MAG: hypothetical protein KDC54_01800 [Lewinella sp.]|nr:hypothetical protein [Lewinella sp.]